MQARVSTGIASLDQMLGGGLLPGTLTIVAGATGIGKTQLGISYLFAGMHQEQCVGALLDLSGRGDSQNHAGYAQRLFGEQWTQATPEMIAELTSPAGVFNQSLEMPNALSMLGYRGCRTVRDQLDSLQWEAWQRQLNCNLSRMLTFFYAHLIRGVRRFLIDGIEPTDRPEDSLQMDLFEYAYHQVIRQEDQWVARDLLRENFLKNKEQVLAHAYDATQTACMLLCTTAESRLDMLIDRPLADGDLFATANTLIYMGKMRDGMKMQRGLYIAKHRGSACDDSVRCFEIDDTGLQLHDAVD